jgi:potassium efflux system protein
MGRHRSAWLGWVVVLAALAAAPAASTQRVGPPPRPSIDSSNAATEAESAAIELRQMEALASPDPLSTKVMAELPARSDEIDNRVDEASNLMESHPSLQVLDALAAEWEATQRELDGWYRGVDRRRQVLGEIVAPETGRLAKLAEPWQQSLPAAEYYVAHPLTPDMRDRMDDLRDTASIVLASVDQTHDDVMAQLSATYGVLKAIDEQKAKVADVVESVREARDQAWDRLFERDGAPVWDLRRQVATAPLAVVPPIVTSGRAGRAAPAAVRPEQGSVRRQARAVWLYLRRHEPNAAIHGGLILVLAVGLIVGRRWVRHWAEADPSLNRATLAFTAPIATAIVLSFVASVWIYPQAPRLFWAALGAAALLPTVYLLRRVVEPRLFTILYALVAFYFADQVRLVAASTPLLARALFLSEMLFGTLLLSALVQARWRQVPTDLFGWVIRIGARAWLAVLAGCLVADAVGYVSLAELVGGAALGGGYLAVILYACTRIVGGLIVILLRSRPLTLLNGVRRHQPLLLRRTTAALSLVAAAFWAVGVLQLLSAKPAVFAAAHWFWGLPVHLGAIEFTPSHVLVFGLTLYAAVAVSRFVQFVLVEDVYVHVELATGSSYAINRMVHYAVIVAGFYVAMGAAGVPFTQLTLLVTALTVGLGFGLQNVVNNFVSGLILLFERPIKVGDLVQMSDTVGTVEYIGIRASIIRTAEGSEVIVPNGNLLSNQLTNFTLSSRQRGLSIPMSIGADAEPQRVMQLLAEVAAAHPMVTSSPPPQVLLLKFTADAFAYELRAWTNAAEQWAQIRSDLAVSIHAALVAAGMTIKS